MVFFSCFLRWRDMWAKGSQPGKSSPAPKQGKDYIIHLVVEKLYKTPPTWVILMLPSHLPTNPQKSIEGTLRETNISPKNGILKMIFRTSQGGICIHSLEGICCYVVYQLISRKNSPVLPKGGLGSPSYGKVAKARCATSVGLVSHPKGAL